MDYLKPCPFCGGKAEHLYWYDTSLGGIYTNIPWEDDGKMHILRCKKCKVETAKFKTQIGCFKAWNRRVDNE